MLLQEVDHILSMFAPVGLNEMDSVRLMNRTDTKYIFPFTKLPELIDRLKLHYRILEISQQRSFPYNTTYLDTPDHLFFYQQMTGKLARYKVRYRQYESTGKSFLEIKKKNNKDRTEKWRIENELVNHASDPAIPFMQKYVPCNPFLLEPVLINRFSRATLVGLETKERITMDYHLSFSDGTGKSLDLPFIAIAELKREGFTSRSPFFRTIKEMGIRPTGFSKYCIGSALLHDLPRTNMLKPKLLIIKKIENESHTIVK